MSYVPVNDLQKYSNVHSDSGLEQNYIDAAENIVNTYLGYSPTLHAYDHLFDGTGTHELQLRAKPVQALIDVAINGETIPVSDFRFARDGEFIYYNRIFPDGAKNIRVEYNAGWGMIPDDDVVNGEYLPEIIKMTVLRIASMLQAEADSNIAVSSKSFGDSGTRTFVNYTDFSKYLLPASIYKILVI
jgi:hypothetical protein